MISTQSMVDDILERMSFSDPREVDTRAGRRIVKSAPIYSNTRKDFWESWNREKAEWQERGYSVGKHGEDWMLTQWLNVDKSVSEMSVEAARRSREEATSGQLPADWVPGDVELTSDQSKLLFSYQVPSAKRLKRALGIGNALDASDTGVGKTIVALVVAKELGLTPCIIAPLAVLPTWTRWAETLGVKIGWVINYDKIRGGKSGLGHWKPVEHGKGEEFVFDYLPGEKPLLVFDESQKIKGVDSKQGNLFRSAARAGHKILALSATAAKDPCDMRNLGAALGLHDGSMNGFIKFCLTHGCNIGRYGLKFNPRNKHMLEKIHREIFPLKGTRLRVCDIPDFPETQIHAETLTCDTASISAAYDEMEIELEKLEADSSKSNSEKSSQGFAAIMKARKAAEKGKLDLFAELATDAIEEGRSVVIFLNFRAHIDVLRKSLKTECVIWGTDMDGRAQKPETRQAHIDDFNADKARICIVSMQAGGAGLSLHDLTGKHPRLSLVSPSYSVIDLKQCLGRVHRAGAKTKSFQRIVFAHGTIEQEICVSLQEKLSNMDRLQDGDLVAPGLAKQLHDLSKHTGEMI